MHEIKHQTTMRKGDLLLWQVKYKIDLEEIENIDEMRTSEQ